MIKRPGVLSLLLTMWLLMPHTTYGNEKCIDALNHSWIPRDSLVVSGVRYEFIGTIHAQTNKTDSVINSILTACSSERFFFEHVGAAPVSAGPVAARWPLDNQETQVRLQRIDALVRENDLIVEIAHKTEGSPLQAGSLDSSLFGSLVNAGSEVFALERHLDMIEGFLDIATHEMEEKLAILRATRDHAASQFLSALDAWHSSDKLTIEKNFLQHCAEDAYSESFCEVIVWRRNSIFAKNLCAARSATKVNVVIVGIYHLLGQRSLQAEFRSACQVH